MLLLLLLIFLSNCTTGGRVGVFHFESTLLPTQFNVALQLENKGWVRSAQKAFFSDKNLSIEEGFSTLFEYKHLLGEFITANCPHIAPRTFTINETNIQEVYFNICSHSQAFAWILKPSLLNNGEGIKLLKKPVELIEHYKQNKRYSGPHVIQEYIHPPHLLNGHKYSLRMFVVLTNEKKVYLYRDGYFNICREPYDAADLTKRQTHMTNEHLSTDNQPNNYQIPTEQCETFSPVYDDIKKILKQLFDKFNQANRKTAFLNDMPSFVLFGVDFMLDENLRTFLLEINHGPCFPTSSQHPLYETLYTPFWEAITNQFVLPIACNTNRNIIESPLFEDLT
jgi:tubulin--tyrosine ligase